jgi:tetratricopeptide (TPR) repeat protein
MKLLDRLFARPATVSPGTVLIGLHFAKTGGTSLLAHAVSQFSDRFAVHGYGPRANSERLFNGERLIEEYDADDLKRVRFVFGHGVSADVAALFPAERVRLFVVCRDPFTRFVSSYKHHVRTDKTGKPLSPRAFLDRQAHNPFAGAVLRGFGAYTPDSQDVAEAPLVDTLRNFEFVLTTEHLDAQSADLFRTVDLPPLSIRKRQFPDDPALEGITADEIYARNKVDTLVSQRANEAFVEQAGASSSAHNPFGFDATERQRFGKAAKAGLAREERIERAYTGLFDMLRAQDRLVSIHQFLSLRDPNSVLPRLERYCAAAGIDPDEESLSGDGRAYLGEAMLRAGDVEAARNILERAVDRHPDSFLSLYHLARTHARTGNWRQAAEFCQRATELNPMHTKSLVLLGRARMNLDQLKEAQAALSRACSLEPSRHKAVKMLADVEARLG